MQILLFALLSCEERIVDRLVDEPEDTAAELPEPLDLTGDHEDAPANGLQIATPDLEVPP